MRSLKILIYAAGVAVALWGLYRVIQPSGDSEVKTDGLVMPPSLVVQEEDSSNHQPELPAEMSTLLELESGANEVADLVGLDEALPPVITAVFTPPSDVLSQVALKMEPPLREIGQAWLSEAGGGDFTMPLPNGDELEIVVERFVAIGEDGGEFIGSVKGFPDSRVELSYRGGGEAGTIRLPSANRMYTMLPGSNGSVVFQERENSDEAIDMAPPISIPAAPDFIPPPPPPLPPELEALAE
jgi:hypothetical protein